VIFKNNHTHYFLLEPNNKKILKEDKMKKILLSLCLLVAATASTAYAQSSRHNGYQNPVYQNSTIDISTQSFTVNVGETKSLSLHGRYFVQKLYIQAESANRSDAYGQVMVNGDVKGTLYVPGRDPHYVVTVAEEASSIEIVSQTNSLRIINVKAVVSSVNSGSGQGPLPYQYRSDMANLANQALYIVNQLEGYTNYRDYGNYLLPIRKIAVQVIAVASARGDASRYGRPQFEALLNSIDVAALYFNDMLERDNAIELGLQLMSIREQIRLRLL